MRRLLILVALPAALQFAEPAPAQSSGFSLEQAKSLLIRHSAVLEADRQEIVQAEAGVETEMAAFIPRLSSGYTPGMPGDPLSQTELRNSLQVGMPIGGGSLTLGSWLLPDYAASAAEGEAGGLKLQWSQPLLRGGRLVGLADRWKVSSRLRDAKLARLEADAFSELSALEQGYWAWVHKQGMVTLLQEEVERAQANHESVKIRIQAHVAAEFELDETAQTIAQYQGQVLEAMQQVAAAETDLVSQLGVRPATGSLRPSESLTVPELELKPNEWVRNALQVNPELKEIRCQLEAAALEQSLAQHDRWPNVSLSLTSNWAGRGTVGSVLPNVAGQAPSFMVGATVETPLGNGPEAATAKETQAKVRALEIRLGQASFALGEHIRLKVREVENLRQRLVLAQKAKDAAHRRYEAERERFERGLVGIQEPLRYQRTLSQARLDELAVRVSLKQAWAKLMQLTSDPAALKGLRE